MPAKPTKGRPKLPDHLLKKRYSVVILSSEAELLIKQFGSLTLAIRAHLLNEPSEHQALDILKQINNLSNKALNK